MNRKLFLSVLLIILLLASTLHFCQAEAEEPKIVITIDVLQREEDFRNKTEIHGQDVIGYAVTPTIMR